MVTQHCDNTVLTGSVLTVQCCVSVSVTAALRRWVCDCLTNLHVLDAAQFVFDACYASAQPCLHRCAAAALWCCELMTACRAAAWVQEFFGIWLQAWQLHVFVRGHLPAWS
jgi:hypothetical protein